MAARILNYNENAGCWESDPLECKGGDVRLRVHKAGPYPVDVMVSIDGDEEYLRHDDFGYDELMCEVTIEGAMPGQFIKLRSRSAFSLIKYIQV
ncbi:MAG: hypothetical protein IKV23_00585 [Bacteroidaceae bacterium]|nr:hypothetical protein [Bacteroidaceae bacterium]